MRKLIDYIFNSWRKHEVKVIFVDEASNISDKTWADLKKKYPQVKIKQVDINEMVKKREGGDLW